MLEPVVGSRQNGSALIPDYLLVMEEPDTQQAIEDFARKFRGVPNVRRLERRNQLERF